MVGAWSPTTETRPQNGLSTNLAGCSYILAAKLGGAAATSGKITRLGTRDPGSIGITNFITISFWLEYLRASLTRLYEGGQTRRKFRSFEKLGLLTLFFCNLLR
ncbi:hypothetical protein K0M31_019517, partial [Melipona bicolor]